MRDKKTLVAILVAVAVIIIFFYSRQPVQREEVETPTENSPAQNETLPVSNELPNDLPPATDGPVLE